MLQRRSAIPIHPVCLKFGVDLAQGTHILIFGDQVAHVTGGVLVKLLIITKDEDCDVNRAEDGELVRLLKQAAFALEEGPIARNSQWLAIIRIEEREL